LHCGYPQIAAAWYRQTRRQNYNAKNNTDRKYTHMSNNWLAMLNSYALDNLSAEATREELTAYAASTDVQMADLSSQTIIEVTGTDATAFLQGQLCNDIALVSPTQAQITGYCTPKGRLLALPTIVGFESGYRLLLPADVAPAFLKRLSMFVMRSEVTIKVLEDWVATAIVESSSAQPGTLEAHLGALPVGALSTASAENVQLIRWHDDNSGAHIGKAGSKSRARYLRLAPVSDQLTLWQGADDVVKRSANVWRLSDISAGIPSITQGIVESFVPQMINLQLINGLSFTKGCYPGQEIVARMQYLGKLKRHMQVFKCSTATPVTHFTDSMVPGGSLSSGTDENAGIVVDAMPLSASAFLILAVTKVAAVDAGFSVADIPLEALDMPYDLPSLEVA